jgi:hypothetical protein
MIDKPDGKLGRRMVKKCSRVMLYALLGALIGAVLLPFAVGHWWPSNTTTTAYTDLDGVHVVEVEVHVSKPVAAAQLIGPIVGGVVGASLAFAPQIGKRTSSHV